jgi:DNA-binding transcriptional LysR family regulator
MERFALTQRLDWEMSVLSRAVAYSNLSGAASHVGLSQPQMSRIVAKLERELKVTLLDRDAKRKAAWTPTAFKLAEVYSRSVRQLASEIEQLVQGSEPKVLKGGTLEGLIPYATSFVAAAFAESQTRIVEMDVFDLSELEEQFFKGELDFILSMREPGRKKYKYTQVLGYQVLERQGSAAGILCQSPFEYATEPGHGHAHQPVETHKILISNSLALRHRWIEDHEGCGILPSVVRARKTREEDRAVLFLGRDQLPSRQWEKMVGWIKKVRVK